MYEQAPMENMKTCKVVCETHSAEVAVQPFSLQEMQEVFWFRTNTTGLKPEIRVNTSTEY